MTTAQALRRAVIALQKWNRKLAFDANIHDMFGENNPSAANAAKIREQNLAAIKVLEKLIKETQNGDDRR